MTNQIPVISTSHNVTITDKKPSSLIGRGLIAIQRKETGLTLFEQDARYRQARDIYNRITHYGDANRFNADLLPNQHELLENPKLIQLQPFFSILQQLADVFIVLQQLVNQGYGKAYFPIARMYEGGQGIKKNINKADYYSRMAFDWCLSSQEPNAPEIWLDLGSMYSGCCNGIEHNNEKALVWCRKAAEFGHAGAECHLGSMYIKRRDLTEALFWYQKSAEQGNAYAQNELGGMYLRGSLNSKKDVEKSVFWYLKAIEQDQYPAIFHLAFNVYGRGLHGKKEDDINVAICYRRLAEQGNAIAQFGLGIMHENGYGIDQDDEQALYWTLKSAEQGYAKSQEKLTKLGIKWKEK